MEAVRGLQPRDEEGGKRITGLQHHHQASQPSFASSCFTERELAETEREGVAASPV